MSKRNLNTRVLYYVRLVATALSNANRYFNILTYNSSTVKHDVLLLLI